MPNQNPSLLETTLNYMIQGAGVALGVMVLTLFYKASKWIKRSLKKNTMATQMICALRVQDYLTELRVLGDAERAYVFQFSNGTYYLNKMSQYQMTCTHQSVKAGIAPVMVRKQEMLVSHTPQFLKALVTGCVCLQVKDMTDVYLKTALLRQGVDLMIACPMMDTKGNLEGFVGMDFMEDTGNPKIGLSQDALSEVTAKIRFELTV